MKRQEMLRQLDQEAGALRVAVDELTRRIKEFKQEEKRVARILDKKETIKKGDLLITQSGASIPWLAGNNDRTVEEWQGIDPNIFIVIRPAKEE